MSNNLFSKLNFYIGFLFILILSTFLIISCSPVSRVFEGVAVSKIIDGDTIVLDSGQKVRYLGIDTPEIDEAYYNEASSLNTILLAGKIIRLETDVTDADVYGRLLRYIYADKILVNAELVKKGFALVYAKDRFPDNKYFDIFRRAADEAATKMLGIWSLKWQHPKILKAASDYYLPTSNKK